VTLQKLDTMQTTLNKSAISGKTFNKAFKSSKKAPRVSPVQAVVAPETKTLVTKRSEEVSARSRSYRA
jgi:hypothetical protein